MKTSVSALALSAALACGPALAENSGSFQVYDSRGQLVGQLLDFYDAINLVAGRLFDFQLYVDKPVANGWFYFKSGNCSGAPLIGDGIPNEVGLGSLAYYQAVSFTSSAAANVFWADDGSVPSMTPVGSIWYQQLNASTNHTDAFCETIPGNASVLLRPAVPLSVTFHPPFCVGGRNGQPCSIRRIDIAAAK